MTVDVSARDPHDVYVTNTEQRIAELGALVRSRRLALELSIEDAAGRVAMSPVTWGRVEKGEKVRALTYSGIERALTWYAGGCQRFLATGEELTLVDPIDLAGDPSASVEGLTDGQLLTELARRLAERQQQGVRYDQAPQPRPQTSSPFDSGEGRDAGGRSPSMTPDDDAIDLVAWRNRNDLVPPTGDELLGAALSEGAVTADDRRAAERIADREMAKREKARGGERDTGDVAEPVEDPDQPQ